MSVLSRLGEYLAEKIFGVYDMYIAWRCQKIDTSYTLTITDDATDLHTDIGLNAVAFPRVQVLGYVGPSGAQPSQNEGWVSLIQMIGERPAGCTYAVVHRWNGMRQTVWGVDLGQATIRTDPPLGIEFPEGMWHEFPDVETAMATLVMKSN